MADLAARVHPYALRLKRPWRAASATLDMRRGALIEISDGERSGWGDCAPLPSSGQAGFAAAFAALDRAAQALRGLTLSAAFAFHPAIENPQARWAAETALLDLSARQRGVTMRAAINAQSANSVAVNAALGPLDADCARRAEAALSEGFAIGKIKVGLLPVEDEIRRLCEVAECTGGRLRLRLDANRAWSVEDARHIFTGISHLPIDGVEEPLARPTLTALGDLQQRVPFAVAVDESLFELGADALIASHAVRRLVMKPARIGGFGAVRRLADRANAAGMDVVLTSVIDSAIGVAACTQLAAAIAPNAAHGLATSSWLAEDVAAPLPVEMGQLVLPATPGLGVIPLGQFAQG